MITELERKEFYEYCIEIGFIIKGKTKPKDWSENKKYRKIKQYIRKGYRIYDYGESFDVINIFSTKYSREIEKNLTEIYLSIRNNKILGERK